MLASSVRPSEGRTLIPRGGKTQGQVSGTTSLTIATGGILNLESTGTITVSSSGGFILSGGSIVAGTAGIPLTSSGGITGYGTVNSTISASAASTATITASGGTLTIQGAITNSGSLKLAVSSGASDKLLLDAASAATSLTFSGSTGTLELNTSGTLTLTNALAIGANTVKLDGAATTQLTDTAGVTLAGGTISGSGSIAASTNISGYGTVAISISTAGSITANGGLLDMQGAITGRTLVITTTTDTLRFDAAGNSTSSLTFNGGTLALNGTGAALTVTGGTVAIGTGTVTLVSGATLTDTTGISLSTGGHITGVGVVNGGISDTGTITASGGTLALTSAISASSGLTFDIADSAASILKLDGTVGDTNTFAFLGTHGALELNDVTITPTGLHFSGTVSGLTEASSATPDLSAINYINAQATITKVTVTNSTHIELWGTGNVDLGTITLGSAIGVGEHVDWAADTSLTNYTIGSGTDVFLSTQPCYLRGTRILTPDGEVPVEDLGAGDLVVTASGAARPVKWIGKRGSVTRLVPPDLRHKVLPVRLARGSLGEGLPKRDLFVSPDHAMALDGVLIMARHLVNGASIAYCDAFPTIEYFYLELPSHDVIFAEGAAAETWLDTGNRNMFSNVLDWPALGLAEAGPRQQPCARMVTEGPLLAAVRQRLQARIPATGFELTTDPDLYLVADGAAVRGECIADKVYRFELTACPERLALMSLAAVPADLDPIAFTDRRPLGVAIRRIVLKSAHATIEFGHDEPSLTEGFHRAETGHRWTSGNGMIPAWFLACLSGPVSVEVHQAQILPWYARRTGGQAVVIPMSADRRGVATAA